MTKLCSWVHGWAVAAALAGALLQPRPAAAFVDCTVSGCGGNTPVLFGTPIIGLNLDGKINGEGVRIVSALERVRPLVGANDCPAGTQLAMDQGRLVGMINGHLVCADQALIGMAFWIEVPAQPCGPRGTPQPGPDTQLPRGVAKAENRAAGTPYPERQEFRQCKRGTPGVKVQIRIDELGEVRTWEVEGSRSVATYRLVWNAFDVPMGSSQFAEIRDQLQQSICPLREAWMETWQLSNLEPSRPNDGCKDPDKDPSKALSARTKRTWYDSTDHVLLMQGETYLPDGSIDRSRVGTSWFNIACVGSAIAKTRLLGFDPMAESPMPSPASGGALTKDQGARQATLKMLTGRYRGDRSYTSPGMPLMWKRPGGPSYYGEPSNWSPNVIESYWDENGAICLAHRRTWRELSSLGASWEVAAMPEGIPSFVPRWWLQLIGYPKAERWSVGWVKQELSVPTCSAPPSKYVWATFPVDHVVH
jgi:hypothetical protein